MFYRLGARTITLRRFSSKRGLGCLSVAREYDVYKSLGDIDMCGIFDIFKVKVPIIFGTV